MTLDDYRLYTASLYLYMSLYHSISVLLLRSWFFDPSCLVCLPFIQLWTIELGRGKHTAILPSSHLEPGWLLGAVKGPSCIGYPAIILSIYIYICVIQMQYVTSFCHSMSVWSRIPKVEDNTAPMITLPLAFVPPLQVSTCSPYTMIESEMTAAAKSIRDSWQNAKSPRIFQSVLILSFENARDTRDPATGPTDSHSSSQQRYRTSTRRHTVEVGRIIRFQTCLDVLDNLYLHFTATPFQASELVREPTINTNV